jgi:hypothetical protein
MTIFVERILVSEGRVEIRLTPTDGFSAGEDLTVTIGKVDRLRDAIVAQIGFSGPESWPLDASIELPDGLYEIARIESGGNTPGGIRTAHSVGGVTKFSVPKSDDASRTISAIRQQRQDLLDAALVAPGCHLNSKRHSLVVYFEGVRLHAPQVLEGLQLLPVHGGVGIEGFEQSVTEHLTSLGRQRVSFSDAAKNDFRSANSVFAVLIPNIRADSMGQALEVGLDTARRVTTVLAIERGERPRRLATFYKDEEGQSLWGEQENYRGNLLAPLFSDEQAAFIEKLMPIVSKSDFAELLLELLAQAVGERNPAYQHFRYWALIEQIAKPKLPGDDLDILRPDGSQMLTSTGRPQKSRGALAKVYLYLRSVGQYAYPLHRPAVDGRRTLIEGAIPQVGDQATEVTSLWDALSGAYQLRNQVAHEGHFSRSPPVTDAEKMAHRLKTDHSTHNGFLSNIATNAVLREVEGRR